MSVILSIESLSKSFGYRKILENISFSIHSGEFVILIGNNGAGKSTLLRIVSSLMKPTKGNIFFRGINQKEILRLWKHRMGYISSENRMYGDLSSKDNLRIYGTFYEIKDLNVKIDEILSKIDLTHVSNLPVRNFSDGMKKRLVIGRIMLYQPEILILDEPYEGLDRRSFHWFHDYLNEFHQKGGTVLMVTHQFELGLELASRILVLQNRNIKHDVSAVGLSIDQLDSWLEEF